MNASIPITVLRFVGICLWTILRICWIIMLMMVIGMMRGLNRAKSS